MEVATPSPCDTIFAKPVSPQPVRRETTPVASARENENDAVFVMNDTQSLIIQLLRKHGSMTRDQLSRRLGLSPMGTSKPLSALSRAGMVTLGQKAQSGPGRPSKSVELSTDRCFSLGITVKHLEVELAIVNLQSQVIDFQRLPFSFAGGITDFAPIYSLALRMIKALPRRTLFAAGLSFSGDFEFDTEHILKTNDFSSPGQADQFRRQLAKKLGTPVTLIHDTEAWLMAERWCNPSLPPNPTLLHVGDRLGFSLMIDGHLCRGTPQWSRWLGRIQVPFSQEKPSGLLPGALAGTADVFSWIDRLQNFHYGERPYESPDAERQQIVKIYQLWKDGDKTVQALVQEGAHDLAVVIRNICLLLPLQRVICTGWIPEIRTLIIDEIRRTLQEIQTAHRYPVSDCIPTVSESTLGEKTEAAGSALWAIDRTLELKMSRRGWKNVNPKSRTSE